MMGDCADTGTHKANYSFAGAYDDTTNYPDIRTTDNRFSFDEQITT